MIWVVFLPLLLVKSVNGQPPSVSMIPQTGSYPIQGESLTLTCAQNSDCSFPLQWFYWNTSNVENTIWSAAGNSPLATSKGVQGSCSNPKGNCNLTMVADKEQDDGPWYCVCLANTTSIVVDINVLVTDVQPVPSGSWHVTESSPTNLTCKTNCVYPAANFTWTSNQSIIQGNIKHWDIPCSGQPDLSYSYSQYTLLTSRSGDYWFNCTAQNVPGWGGVGGQFIVFGTHEPMPVGAIVGIVFGCVAIIVIIIVVTVWIWKYKDSTDVEFVFKITPSKEEAVVVRAKCARPNETVMKAGDVKVTWPDENQSEAVIAEETGADGVKKGILVVEGTGADGKQGVVAVVKTVQSLIPPNSSKLVVLGSKSNGKKVNALIVRVTWPDGAKGYAVVIKGTE